MKNILVTGGAGFIGSNFVRYILDEYKDTFVLNLDLLTYAGNVDNLIGLDSNPNYKFVKGNIGNRELVDLLIKEHQIDTVINFAAESHVDRSILNPEVFIETNVLGTLNLLNVAKTNNVNRFVQVSTDEVYGSLPLGEDVFFTEDTPLAPNSPYSASKASADMLALSYHETYGMNVVITRCSNNYGPYQHPEKLIPLMVTNSIDQNLLPVYGTGENVRDWLHVYDHCSAIALVAKDGIAGEVYNVGGHNERSNNEIVDLIMKEFNLPEEVKTHVEDRLGHDLRYGIDPSKIINELGWKPRYNFDTGIDETIKWYKGNEQWWRPILNKK